MLRHAYVILTALAIGLPILAADEKTELKALAGRYDVVKVEVDGKDLTESFKTVTLAIDGDKYTAIVGQTTDKGTLAVDGTKSPKTMDITGTEGPNRGMTYPCLFEVKDDVFTVCYGLDFKTRPKEMTTAEKSNRMIIVYKRKK